MQIHSLLIRKLGKTLILFLGIIFPIVWLLVCWSSFDQTQCTIILASSHDIGINLLFAFWMSAWIWFIMYSIVLWQLFRYNRNFCTNENEVEISIGWWLIYILILTTIMGWLYQYFATISAIIVFILLNIGELRYCLFKRNNVDSSLNEKGV